MISVIVPHTFMHKNYYVDDLKIGEKNYYMESDSDMKIKGVTVAKTIKMLQGEPMVFTFVGGLHGKYIKNHLYKIKIKDNLVFTKDNTEFNIKIIDSKNKTKTIIRDKKMSVEPKEFAQYMNKLDEWKNATNVVVIDDFYTRNINEEMYEEILKLYNFDGTRLIVNLRMGEEDYKYFDLATPYAIRVSRGFDGEVTEELIEELAEYYSEYIKKGVHYVVVNLGFEGCLFISKNKTCVVKFSEPVKKLTYEASEAFVGALAVGVERKYEQEKISKLALSTTMSVLNNNGLMSCTRNDIERNTKKVKSMEMTKK